MAQSFQKGSLFNPGYSSKDTHPTQIMNANSLSGNASFGTDYMRQPASKPQLYQPQTSATVMSPVKLACQQQPHLPQCSNTATRSQSMLTASNAFYMTLPPAANVKSLDSELHEENDSVSSCDTDGCHTLDSGVSGLHRRCKPAHHHFQNGGGVPPVAVLPPPITGPASQRSSQSSVLESLSSQDLNQLRSHCASQQPPPLPPPPYAAQHNILRTGNYVNVPSCPASPPITKSAALRSITPITSLSAKTSYIDEETLCSLANRLGLSEKNPSVVASPHLASASAQLKLRTTAVAKLGKIS